MISKSWAFALLRPNDVCRQAFTFASVFHVFSLFLTITQTQVKSRSGDKAGIYQKFGAKMDLKDSLAHFAQPFYEFYRGSKSSKIWLDFRHHIAFDALWNEMKNEKCNDLKCVQKPTQSRLSLTHHANKSSRWADTNIKWSESPWNQSGIKTDELVRNLILLTWALMTALRSDSDIRPSFPNLYRVGVKQFKIWPNLGL